MLDSLRKTVWEGAEQLRSLLVPLVDLAEHPENPRRGNATEIGKSLRRFGQTKPIVVSANGVIAAGNHTYRAAREIGWTHIAAVRVEMSESELRSYLIADNRLSDLGGYEDAQLADVLQSLRRDDLLEGIGWYDEDIDDLLSKRDEEAVEVDEPVEPPVSTEPLRQVVVAYRQEEYDRLVRAISHLERTLGTNGFAETIYFAVTRQAEAEGLDSLE